MTKSGFDPLEVEKALKSIPKSTKGKKQVKKTMVKKEKIKAKPKEVILKKKLLPSNGLENEKKIEKEIKEFHVKPKKVREEKSQEFDFSKITSQIKEKVKEQKLSGEEIPNFNDSNIPVSEITQERIPTGIPGLDGLIEGGFEKGSTILTVGSAGFLCGRAAEW